MADTKNPYLPDQIQDYYKVDGGYRVVTIDRRTEPYKRTSVTVKYKPKIAPSSEECRAKAAQWYKENS